MKVAWKVNHYGINTDRTPKQIKRGQAFWKRLGILFFADKEKAEKFCEDTQNKFYDPNRVQIPYGETLRVRPGQENIRYREATEGPKRVTYPEPEEIIT